MAITSVVCDIFMQFGFEIWFQLSANECTYDILVHKEQRDVTMVTNFGTTIAINAFIQEITRV